MKIKYWISLPAITLGLLACSWITDFIVANEALSPITISYKFKVRDDRIKLNCDRMLEEYAPSITPITKINDHEFRTLSANEYEYDGMRCEVKITIQPKQAVRIGRIGTYTGHSSDRGQYFNVERLTIMTEKGALSFERQELVRQFKKEEKTKYVLWYQ